MGDAEEAEVADDGADGEEGDDEEECPLFAGGEVGRGSEEAAQGEGVEAEDVLYHEGGGRG